MRAAGARDWPAIAAAAVAAKDASSCRALWCAVVWQALADAEGGKAAARDAVRAWLGCSDFERVCMSAGVCPQQARARIEAALAGTGSSGPARRRRRPSRVDHPRRAA